MSSAGSSKSSWASGEDDSAHSLRAATVVMDEGQTKKAPELGAFFPMNELRGD
jgi:hypothetical protein